MVKVKIKKRKAGRIAYIEHTGDYGQIPFDEYYDKLYAHAKANKLKPGFKPLAIYFDDPEKTPAEQCRSEVGIPIYGSGQSGDEIKIKELPEMQIAVTKFAAPAEEYPRVYGEIGKWVEENGYCWDGAPIEVYGKKPKMKDGKMIMFSEIQVPVKPK